MPSYTDPLSPLPPLLTTSAYGPLVTFTLLRGPLAAFVHDPLIFRPLPHLPLTTYAFAPPPPLSHCPHPHHPPIVITPYYPYYPCCHLSGGSHRPGWQGWDTHAMTTMIIEEERRRAEGDNAGRTWLREKDDQWQRLLSIGWRQRTESFFKK